VNTVTASFDATRITVTASFDATRITASFDATRITGQMTEMSQRKKNNLRQCLNE